ncbi:Bug family tripartite tricarboxylate transporter substrate binding protein [Pigmentiphaga kullae]|uniref:Tripartite-type tricarboxylate transporter receptor subunit TctC n=1 Tax=Pigmentiphaga kullae TaxID=151784 RepID=A0A4Q7NA54_9BURK|nr:tripartite tricarboxylate transporter substrate binding protein [Pigmentiphaga kullae]RZS78761.1 tripartite-type tricarboxylate transporter receptor subunit TctC [Pigmentiphaga kullae]
MKTKNTKRGDRASTSGLVLAAALAAAWAGPGQAADAGAFPAKTVRMVVPVSAGGSTDKIARLLAEKLNAKWGQAVVVENVTGAGGSIGAAQVAKAAPDGYTLLLHSDAVVLNTALLKKPPYTLKDFSGVVRAIANPQILVVRPTLGVKTFQQYLALAKKSPGQVTVGLPTSGGIAHIAHEMIQAQTGIDVNYIPYPGGGPAAVDVMGGHIDATMITMAAVTEFIKAGRLVPLAVTTSYRSAALPDVPTVAESGVPGFDVESWQGILAPARTPAAVVEKINRDVMEILRQPDIKAQVESMGYGVAGGTPAEFDKSLRQDLERYSKVIKDARITLQ